MTASRRPWPGLAFVAVLAFGAFARESTPASAQTTPARAPAALRDVAYGAHPRQRFDVYVPARTQGAPTIFFVHGGGWRAGDKRTGIGAKAAHWTAAGAIVISSNYRLVPDADPVEQARDIARAIAAAQRKVAELGGDPDAFVLMGHSAGAHLVGLLAVSPSMAAQAGAQPWRGSVLLDSGAIDVEATMRLPRKPKLYDTAFGSDPALWRAASPMAQLNGKTAPILAVCAEARRVSCAPNRAFLDKARGYGTRTQLLPKALNHMQINRDLGVDAAYTGEVDAFLRSVGLRI